LAVKRSLLPKELQFKKENNMVEKDRRVVDAMVEGKPLKRYKKTILGKVYVTALDPFSDEPEGVILQGNPNNPDELDTQVIEIWDERQDLFFRRINKRHFEAGRLMMITELPKAQPSVNDVSEDELDEILKLRFMAFKAKLNAFTEEAPVYRLLNRARELEKSDKIVKHIETRLLELQNEKYVPEPEE
jgi:hypothetical protein